MEDKWLTPVWHWALVSAFIAEGLFHLPCVPPVPRQEVSCEMDERCLCDVRCGEVLSGVNLVASSIGMGQVTYIPSRFGARREGRRRPRRLGSQAVASSCICLPIRLRQCAPTNTISDCSGDSDDDATYHSLLIERFFSVHCPPSVRFVSSASAAASSALAVSPACFSSASSWL
jgi:hypothetical protein